MEIEKALVETHVFASPVLLTNGLSVSSVWLPGLIENLTIWPSDFQNSTYLASCYILLVHDFSFAEKAEKLKQKENLE